MNVGIDFIPSVAAYFDAVRTFTSKFPLNTNSPGFQSKFSLVHSQCKFSVVLYGSWESPNTDCVKTETLKTIERIEEIFKNI